MPPKKKKSEAPKRTVDDVRRDYEPKQEAMRAEILALKQAIEVSSARHHATVVDLELTRDRNILTEGRLESKREVLESAMEAQREKIDSASEKAQFYKGEAHIKNIRVAMLTKEVEEYAANRKVPEKQIKAEQLEKALGQFFSANPHVAAYIRDRDEALQKAADHQMAVSTYHKVLHDDAERIRENEVIELLEKQHLSFSTMTAAQKQQQISILMGRSTNASVASVVSTTSAAAAAATIINNNTSVTEESSAAAASPTTAAAVHVDPAVLSALDEDIQLYTKRLAEKKSKSVDGVRRVKALLDTIGAQEEAAHLTRRQMAREAAQLRNTANGGSNQQQNAATSTTLTLAAFSSSVAPVESERSKSTAPLQLTFIHGGVGNRHNKSTLEGPCGSSSSSADTGRTGDTAVVSSSSAPSPLNIDLNNSPCGDLVRTLQTDCGFVLCKEVVLSNTANKNNNKMKKEREENDGEVRTEASGDGGESSSPHQSPCQHLSATMLHTIREAMTRPAAPFIVPLVVIEGYVKTRGRRCAHNNTNNNSNMREIEEEEEVVVMCDPSCDPNDDAAVTPLNTIVCELVSAAPRGWDQGTLLMELAPADDVTQGIAIMTHRGSYLSAALPSSSSSSSSSSFSLSPQRLNDLLGSASIVFLYNKIPLLVGRLLEEAVRPMEVMMANNKQKAHSHHHHHGGGNGRRSINSTNSNNNYAVGSSRPPTATRSGRVVPSGEVDSSQQQRANSLLLLSEDAEANEEAEGEEEGGGEGEEGEDANGTPSDAAAAAAANVSSSLYLLGGKAGRNSHCGLVAALVTYLLRESATPAPALNSASIIGALRGALDNPSAQALFAGIGRLLRPLQQRSVAKLQTILCVPPQLVRAAARGPHRQLVTGMLPKSIVRAIGGGGAGGSSSSTADRLFVLPVAASSVSSSGSSDAAASRPWLCVARAEGNKSVYERLRRKTREQLAAAEAALLAKLKETTSSAARLAAGNSTSAIAAATKFSPIPLPAAVAPPPRPAFEPFSVLEVPVLIAQASTAIELRNRLSADLCSREERMLYLRNAAMIGGGGGGDDANAGSSYYGGNPSSDASNTTAAAAAAERANLVTWMSKRTMEDTKHHIIATANAAAAASTANNKNNDANNNASASVSFSRSKLLATVSAARGRTAPEIHVAGASLTTDGRGGVASGDKNKDEAEAKRMQKQEKEEEADRAAAAITADGGDGSPASSSSQAASSNNTLSSTSSTSMAAFISALTATVKNNASSNQSSTSSSASSTLGDGGGILRVILTRKDVSNFTSVANVALYDDPMAVERLVTRLFHQHVRGPILHLLKLNGAAIGSNGVIDDNLLRNLSELVNVQCNFIEPFARGEGEDVVEKKTNATSSTMMRAPKAAGKATLLSAINEDSNGGVYLIAAKVPITLSHTLRDRILTDFLAELSAACRDPRPLTEEEEEQILLAQQKAEQEQLQRARRNSSIGGGGGTESEIAAAEFSSSNYHQTHATKRASSLLAGTSTNSLNATPGHASEGIPSSSSQAYNSHHRHSSHLALYTANVRGGGGAGAGGNGHHLPQHQYLACEQPWVFLHKVVISTRDGLGDALVRQCLRESIAVASAAGGGGSAFMAELHQRGGGGGTAAAAAVNDAFDDDEGGNNNGLLAPTSPTQASSGVGGALPPRAPSIGGGGNHNTNASAIVTVAAGGEDESSVERHLRSSFSGIGAGVLDVSRPQSAMGGTSAAAHPSSSSSALRNNNKNFAQLQKPTPNPSPRGGPSSNQQPLHMNSPPPSSARNVSIHDAADHEVNSILAKAPSEDKKYDENDFE